MNSFFFFYSTHFFFLITEHRFKPVTSMRKMEHFTRLNKGAPFLYANTFMNHHEFNEMFDMSLYERVRLKYNATHHFHHLYNKTAGCQSFNFQDMLREENSEIEGTKKNI